MSAAATIRAAPTQPDGLAGLEGLWIVYGFGLLGLVAFVATVINFVALGNPGPLTAARIGSAVLSILLGLCLIAGAFVLHPNAPHQWNWYVLTAGLAVAALGAAVLFCR